MAIRPASVAKAESLRWIREHSDVLRSYSGKWVAIEGESVVGVGKSVAEALYRAETKGVHSPVVLFIEKE